MGLTGIWGSQWYGNLTYIARHTIGHSTEVEINWDAKIRWRNMWTNGPWWWSCSQRACLLLQRSMLESLFVGTTPSCYQIYLPTWSPRGPFHKALLFVFNSQMDKIYRISQFYVKMGSKFGRYCKSINFLSVKFYWIYPQSWCHKN